VRGSREQAQGKLIGEKGRKIGDVGMDGDLPAAVSRIGLQRQGALTGALEVLQVGAGLPGDVAGATAAAAGGYQYILAGLKSRLDIIDPQGGVIGEGGKSAHATGIDRRDVVGSVRAHGEVKGRHDPVFKPLQLGASRPPALRVADSRLTGP